MYSKMSFCLILIITVTQVTTYYIENVDDDDALFKACGLQAIRNKLKVACKGRVYNTNYYRKRMFESDEHDPTSNFLEDVRALSFFDYPFKSGYEENPLVADRRFKRQRGIHDDCCLEMCSINQIRRDYCSKIRE